MISAGHGDVPLVRLRFRRLRCHDRLDFVVRGKDVVRPWPWCWLPLRLSAKVSTPMLRRCSTSPRRKSRRRFPMRWSLPSLPARIGRVELGTLGEAAPVVGRNGGAGEVEADNVA